MSETGLNILAQARGAGIVIPEHITPVTLETEYFRPLANLLEFVLQPAVNIDREDSGGEC